MSKDWLGNSNSTFKQLGASNHCNTKRQEHDFYAANPKAIEDLLKYESFDKNVWECAVGKGHLAKVLKDKGFNVKASDIINRGYEDTKIMDFIKEKHKFNGDIITNPPYRFCSEFILNALDSIPNGHKVAMFLKLTTLEGQKRYEEIYSKYPPKVVYVYVKRIQCGKNGEFDGSSAVCYAWFVWVKGDYKRTEIKWIN